MGYAGYYLHSRSSLNLTLTRAYSAILGRFINRDFIEENGGINLYEYVMNDPVRWTDPFGFGQDCCKGKTGWALYICMRDNDPCRGLGGWLLMACRFFNPGSRPEMPYDPSSKTIDQLEQDQAPEDIIDREIIRRGTEAGLSQDQISRELLESHQHAQNIKEAWKQYYRQLNRPAPVKTIINKQLTCMCLPPAES